MSSAMHHHVPDCALTPSEQRIYELLAAVNPGETTSATALAGRSGLAPTTVRRHLNIMRFKQHAHRRPDGGWDALTPDARGESVAREVDAALRKQRKRDRDLRVKIDRWARRATKFEPNVDADTQETATGSETVEIITTVRRGPFADADRTLAMSEPLRTEPYDSGLADIDALLCSLGVD